MCGGYIMCTWRGPGRTYQRPVGAGAHVTSANEISRHRPFKDEPMAHLVTSPGGQNTGDPSIEWGATRTADEISRAENFKF